MNARVRVTVGLTAMLLGNVGVFGLVYYMNEATSPPKPEKVKAANEFKVEKEPPKRQEPKPQSQPRQRERAASAHRAPAPNIATSLSGMSFDLPQFETDDLGGADELLDKVAGNDDLVHDSASLDELPRYDCQRVDIYPEKARVRAIEGEVVVQVTLDERGGMRDIRVKRAEPAGVFEEAAVNYIKQHCTWQPGMYGGERVPAVVQVPIPFKLS
jgi:protein TonB